jgi:hypothetical protein
MVRGDWREKAKEEREDGMLPLGVTARTDGHFTVACHKMNATHQTRGR